MSAPTIQQVKALIWRYWLVCIRWPTSTAFRLVIWPALLIGILVALMSYTMDPFTEGGGPEKSVILSLFPSLILPFITSVQVYHYVKWINGDRNNGMKSLMLSMGVKNLSLYLSHSMCFMAGIFPVMMLLATIMIIYIFDDSQSSPLAILTVFVLFTVHLTGFVFAISSLFTTSKFVELVLLILMYENGFPYLVWLIAQVISQSTLPMVLFLASMSPWQSIRILFSSYKVCKNCNEAQISEYGAVAQPTGLIMAAMLFWSIVAFAFAQWFEEVCPWQRDSAVKGPLFCLKSGSSASSDRDHSIELVGGLAMSVGQSKYFESVSQVNRKVGIRIKKVRKLYKSKPAVDDLTLDIYKGETTLLLGHNGAGKTTLMDIILGRLSYDGGHVSINESSLGSGVGLCPQASIFDQNLTVRQHLDLFYSLKSLVTGDLEREQHIDATLKDVYLAENADKLPGQLSGGMQRKLSLAMAFVGDSSVLVLDEPSSGLDPESRQSIWTTIRRYRTDKTVLLSTQHMEEADYLGDRVAIMKAGKIICCGSSIFLNNLFGSGYRLRVECKASDAQQVLGLVRDHFLGADLSNSSTSVGDQISDAPLDLAIELNADPTVEYESKLIDLLEALERQSEGERPLIKSFGLKSSSMEDVLLKSKDATENENLESGATRVTILPSRVDVTSLTRVNSERDESVSFMEQQKLFLRAIFIKNLQMWANDKGQFIIRLLLNFAGCWFAIVYLDNLTDGIPFSQQYSVISTVIFMIYYPTAENVTKFKILQLSSNANFIVYWLAQLASDLILISLLVMMINILLATAFEGEFIVAPFEGHLVVSLAILLFGAASAVVAYVLSTMIKSVTGCIGYFSLFLVLNGIASFILYIIGLIISKDMMGIIEVAEYMFALFVPLPALQRIFNGFVTQCYVKARDRATCEPADNFISPVLIGFACLMAQIVGYSLALYLIESRRISVVSWVKLRILRRHSAAKVVPEANQFDEDVLAESRKVTHLIGDPLTAQATHSLLAVDLSKSYAPKVKAVDHLSFGVKKAECFGLLGVNGAGKTTAFSMIAREMLPDSGCIWLGPSESLGYDPQSSPEMLLTVRQALFLMARLRRVPERNIAELVRDIIELLELTEHSQKMAKDLSGGSKRKLYLGMSLIGNTSLLALDEPTAGVDPIARWKVWQLLKSVRQNNRASILVSSHVMEECEAICDRLAIMARGRLRCVGTLLHLRSKFSQSSTVKVQFVSQVIGKEGLDKDSIVAQIKARLEEELDTSSLEVVDSNFNSATLKISEGNIKRSVLFKVLRDYKARHPEMRYQVNDSSFEDIFLAVAREQQDFESN